ncbi:alpha/beta fold hydrolase [Kitasatospora sp. NPDC056783]|uniref:alpha/beta fold hydrolase n=1 Tax=Kitasatospora sp. NPDC056783 TaxID=3345943 RepID=UPI00369ED758
MPSFPSFDGSEIGYELVGRGEPLVVLAGAFDGMTGTAPARALAACLPHGGLDVLVRSGHRPWAEEPERFVALVDGFLTGLRTP